MPVGMEIEPKGFADIWVQLSRQPERQLGRAVTANEQVCAAGRGNLERAWSPIFRREPQAANH